MYDREPQTDASLLDQVRIINPPHALRLDHTLDQPFVFLQQGFQAVRAARLGTNKSIHSLRVANSSFIHNGTSFRSEIIEIPDLPARRCLCIIPTGIKPEQASSMF